ncbi:MAG: urea carboxylase-associated protein 1 [Verrucomicrobiales bacterium]|nr:urea carboxylase-associated protein 1 [Verrucomicrobiales bacterium]
MTTTQSVSSNDPMRASYQTIVRAGDPWFHRISKGSTIRITDLEGNQAVDTLFYNADDPTERYSADETIRGQNNIYLTTGSVLLSNLQRPLLTITADTCGRHDSLGGGCSAESNTVRYSLDKKYMHNCRDSFLLGLSRAPVPMGIRDLVPNINFFMNVPVTPEGGLEFADGISGPGRYVELTAQRDVFCLISNCPQLNNPCNGYNPTPAGILIWE